MVTAYKHPKNEGELLPTLDEIVAAGKPSGIPREAAWIWARTTRWVKLYYFLFFAHANITDRASEPTHSGTRPVSPCRREQAWYHFVAHLGYHDAQESGVWQTGA